jgi:hypothetical protein
MIDLWPKSIEKLYLARDEKVKWIAGKIRFFGRSGVGETSILLNDRVLNVLLYFQNSLRVSPE